jgi:hypothetical protein
MLNNVGYILLNYKPNESFETYIIQFKGEKETFFSHLVDCWYSLGLEFVAPSVRNNRTKK